MIPGKTAPPVADRLAQELRAFIDVSSKASGGTGAAERPGHRVQFHWPPHPISYRYHLHPTDWRGRAKLTLHGETFELQVANTPHGVFGRCEALWLEAKGATHEEMLANFELASRPLFERQLAISRTLGRQGRFTGHVRDLEPIELLKLLYCPDRDVAHEAQTTIELRASQGIFLPSLIEVLRDDRHPHRRSAQWCVLDLFEDLASFCHSKEEESAAVSAMRGLIWNADDDYARTVYKAGVVIGGHLPAEIGGATLIDCLDAPSPIGRRSAIHGLFHVVEWKPETRNLVVSALRARADREPVEVLREYALRMADDIERGEYDHVSEPVLPGEA
jgi:hypothetical protein